MDQDSEFGTLARMVVAALISGVITATLVVAIGRPLLERAVVRETAAHVVLVRTSG